MTEFNVGGQKLYLSPILDLYNGEIISYEIARRPLFGMVDEMLKKPSRSLVHATGQSCIPTKVGRADSIGRRLIEHRVKQSMSRKGNCLDNETMESFFGTLKSKFFYLKKFLTIDDLQAGLKDYIHYYNKRSNQAKIARSEPGRVSEEI